MQFDQHSSPYVTYRMTLRNQVIGSELMFHAFRNTFIPVSFYDL